MTRDQIVVRRSRRGTAAMVAWIGFLSVPGFATIGKGNVAWGVFLLACWWPYLVPVLLNLRQEVRITDGLLIARGWSRQWKWSRDTIAGFAIMSPQWAPNWAWLAVDLGPCGKRRLPGTLGSGYGALQRRLEKERDVLETWRNSAAPPNA